MWWLEYWCTLANCWRDVVDGSGRPVGSISRRRAEQLADEYRARGFRVRVVED